VFIAFGGRNFSLCFSISFFWPVNIPGDVGVIVMA
jgi:hypothetical protein